MPEFIIFVTDEELKLLEVEIENVEVFIKSMLEARVKDIMTKYFGTLTSPESYNQNLDKVKIVTLTSFRAIKAELNAEKI